MVDDWRVVNLVVRGKACSYRRVTGFGFDPRYEVRNEQELTDDK